LVSLFAISDIHGGINEVKHLINGVKADFVIIAGDITNFFFDTSVIRSHEQLNDLKGFFDDLNLPCYYLFGNRDINPRVESFLSPVESTNFTYLRQGEVHDFKGYEITGDPRKITRKTIFVNHYLSPGMFNRDKPLLAVEGHVHYAFKIHNIVNCGFVYRDPVAGSRELAGGGWLINLEGLRKRFSFLGSREMKILDCNHDHGELQDIEIHVPYYWKKCPLDPVNKDSIFQHQRLLSLVKNIFCPNCLSSSYELNIHGIYHCNDCHQLFKREI